MLIGQVAKEAGVSIHTVRYYENYGLIGAARRRANNYKEYAPSAVRFIKFVQSAQELGFTLAQLKEIVKIVSSKTATCQRLGKIAEKRLVEIDDKIAELKTMRNKMHQLIDGCRSKSNGLACEMAANLL